MTVSRRHFLQAISIAAAGATMLQWGAPGVQAQAATSDPNLHLLNRLTYGPRPEDVARIHAIGYEAFLDEQLNPEQIDDSHMDSILLPFGLLKLDRHALYGLDDAYFRSYQALIGAMISRAVYSKRQLLERMVEFWADHFNVAGDDSKPDQVSYQRDAIRANALGNFRALVLATARHPAMLYYLDNAYNIAEHPNENYARELLELHTMGVDGGYTEEDVKNVARAFTGWTVHDSTADGFYFDKDNHDTAAKTILGHALPTDRGIEDGLHVIGLICAHPSTAQFISRKLCVRFVSDDPPQSLVDSTAAVFQQNQGEIKPVLRHIFLSSEFQASVGQKLRRPLDFFIGVLRATGTQIHEFWRFEETLQALGQVPYNWLPPNGYPDVAGAWMSSNGLLTRWNVAMQLTHDAASLEYQPLTTDLLNRIGQPQTVGPLVGAVAEQVFGAPLPPEQNAEFIAYAADGGDANTPADGYLISRKAATLFGLMLSSPLYQWR
ncbi:MAG: DUF1800 domain-containing protein [Anaerolineaceae bacterium]|nr:DUF1800 domain-containing protein [Anaerolineaceae bacterium]